MTIDRPTQSQEHSYARRAARASRRALVAPVLRAARPLARILVSEDDPAIRELYTRLLTDHGFEVLAAPRGDGGRTLELARRAGPGLLISDVHKPGLDGLGLQAALRADRRTAHIPLLLVSAVELGARQASLTALDDFLLKPFIFEDLVERAAALLPLGEADQNALAMLALRRGCAQQRHPLSGLPCLHPIAAALPAATAAPGWAAVALSLAERPTLLRAHGRLRLDLLVGQLGTIVRGVAADLLAGHIGLDGQIALVGAPSAVALALAQIDERFAAATHRLTQTAPGLPRPALALRRADASSGLGIDLLTLRRALR